MTELNTTRESREEFYAEKFYPDVNGMQLEEAYKDIDTLEDELARVRERLEAAEEVIALAERVENLLDKEEWKPTTDAPEGPMSMPWNDYWDLGELETLLHFALTRYREGGRNDK